MLDTKTNPRALGTLLPDLIRIRRFLLTDAVEGIYARPSTLARSDPSLLSENDPCGRSVLLRGTSSDPNNISEWRPYYPRP